jgi:G3E family GTPase
MPLLCETFAATDSLRDRGETAGEADDRLLVDLLTEQVEFADVVVVNKLDLVDETQRGQLIGLLKTFNPHAEIITAQQGQVPLGKVLGTGRFDFTRASQAAGWAQALSGHHLPESEEFGITSFVWRARRPLHPARFEGRGKNSPDPFFSFASLSGRLFGRQPFFCLGRGRAGDL